MSKKFWLSNVLLEKGFKYDSNNNIIGTRANIENLLIDDGKIIDIRVDEIPKDGTPVIDAKGLLALPSLIEKHIHLDKGHFGGPWKASTPFTSVFDRIKEEEGFLRSFLPYTKERAEKLLHLITSYGVTHASVQCNVDPVIGLSNVEKVSEALESYKDKLTYKLTAFPQHGLLRSDSIPFMKEAMRNGVEVVGGLDPATIDNDIESSLQKMMDIAVEFNADVDIHLHDRGSLGVYTIKRLAQLVEEAKWQGRVNISHGYCMGDITLEEVSELAEVLTELEISLATTSPIDVPGPPIPLLYEKGVKIYIINDNINDHWSPFGTGDLLQRASRMAEKFGWIDEYSLTRAIGFITNSKIPLDREGKRNWPQIGDEASMIFINSSCSAESIARVPERRTVMFRGSIVSGTF
ncbi:putative deaminase with metallo-dependent hydrolase domain [Gottschalkia acidurici 9a]|uniref:Deaminase with metallo-dependent hydrolase domain n=1 Tax=Gottschalkia acidurici (strain ATCC 7906 / DSM 604 / BCRC 14475 / CIP 104303 / KCTC 5404 / NCIMB 10678 / 9a) TaxID=1128398 RepID=K0AZ06_GOTA9|nr:amidohydrolase [Gottschalkia acidurici]AFS77910.1 putative deaminase with metallo-dependent hydrolase domain [Gottschalkia acidurici 9a]